MTDQAPLFPPGKPITPLRAMTARQMRIYELICAQPDGLTAQELGQLLHDQARRHHRSDICEFCGQDGGRALREKAIRQRLIRRPEGVYEPRSEADWTGKVREPSSQIEALPGESFEDIFGDAA